MVMMGLWRSEWLKLRSVRSTYLSFGLTVLLSVGGGAAAVASLGTIWVGVAGEHGVYDPTAPIFGGVPFAQLVLAVGGVLAGSSEYSTGTIATSLIAVPRRVRFFGAKVTAFALVALAVSEVTAFGCFFAAQAVLAAHVPHVVLGQPHVARAVIGTGIDLTLVGLLGLALGSLLRRPAPAIATIVVLVFFPSQAVRALPAWLQTYLPTLAGTEISNVVRLPNSLPAWTGLGLMGAFTAAVLAAALIRLCITDA